MRVKEAFATLHADPDLASHPQAGRLLELLCSRIRSTPSGYPYLDDAIFIGFIRRVPHLFRDGLAILHWADRAEDLVSRLPEHETRTSLEGALRVLRAMVRTAAVTAPSDLWLMRQVLGEHARRGIVDDLLADRILEPASYATERELSRRQLKIDFHFLYARGYVDHEAPCFLAPPSAAVRAALARVTPLPASSKGDWVERWMDHFDGGGATADLVEWLAFAGGPDRARTTWIPILDEIEIGYRLVPIVLALQGLGMTSALGVGREISTVVPHLFEAAEGLLTRAGCVAEGRVTALGARVFARAPGPFGIIHAYHPYLDRLDEVLGDQRGERTWVRRGANVAASQDANRKTFQLANQALDAFCEATGFRFTSFVEHAVGKGEAVRQRFLQDGEADVRYFGADLEDAAIEEAEAEQRAGRLPANMEFIRGADIGQPLRVVDHLRRRGLEPRETVMMVGNGFHEVRDQTNERMIEAFRGYAAAGVVVIFTEETGLTDADLRATAWNTYHAGFRYVHEMSGQGLRPSWDSAFRKTLWSWRRCAEAAGYVVLDEYTRGTRPIYPIRKPHRENPSISVTYFCIPRALAESLGVVHERKPS